MILRINSKIESDIVKYHQAMNSRIFISIYLRLKVQSF